MSAATDLAVPRTILEQLGGAKFKAFTGASGFLGSANMLRFRLPGGGGFTKHGINCVAITLTPMDVYEIEFCRIRGSKMKLIETRNDVYAEDLRAIFTEVTGLRVSL